MLRLVFSRAPYVLSVLSFLGTMDSESLLI